MPVSSSYSPQTAIYELGEGFYDEVKPARFPNHKLRFRNQTWASRLGLGELSAQEWTAHFGKFEPLPRNITEPLARRYHGHQFRSYNPELGDGRGFLFAQLRDPLDGRLLDLGTKGSGQTPFSRSGDGRLTLKGSVREALATEMLESLGVYTSKTFSVFETGEELERHDEPSPTRSAVLVRLNHSHIRFGSFQRQAYLSDKGRIQKLIDYSIQQYFPEIEKSPASERAGLLLGEVAERSADLCASWMIAGFVHGVLNTDNMTITGESFDYGPYRFVPKYDPAFTAAYFDHTGLYAFGRQPESVLWNLEQLGSCFTLVANKEPLMEALQRFAPRFNEAILRSFVARMGFERVGGETDDDLFVATFNFLSASQVGFDQFFHDWYGGLMSRERARKSPEASVYKGEVFEAFFKNLEGREASQAAITHLQDSYFQNPKPCSLLIDEIEWIWDAIATNDDWSRFEKKIDEIREMGKVYGRRQI